MRAYLGEVAAALDASGPQHVLVIVGGALLALHDLRETTHDIDSVTRLDGALREAVAAVAVLRGLSPDGLNDRARGFVPATFDPAACEPVFESGRLTVLGAPFGQVFAMKLYRNDAQDYEDMIRIWPLCGFDSPQAAVDAFVEAYPHAPGDEHLIDLIRQIADAAS